MVLREAGVRPERLLEDGRPEPLGEADQRRPALGVVGAAPTTSAGARASARKATSSVSTPPGRRRPPGGPARCGVLALLVGSGVPVVHRDDHDCRATVGLRFVRSAEDRAGDICSTYRLVDLDGIPGETYELSRQELFEGQVPPVLLADEHDERARFTRAVARAPTAFPSPAVVRAKAGCSLASAQPGEADNGPFVQCKHEAEVIREVGEERDLGRAGFPKTVVSPRSRRTSNVASRTVVTSRPVSRKADVRYENIRSHA